MENVIWSEKSVSDLEEIFDYIAMDSPFYAQHQVEKIIASVGTAIDLSDLWSFSS